MKILIIEDSKTIANYLAELLSKEKYFVTIANNGKQAFELLKTKTFRLVLLDLNLPDISGTEILRNIRDTKNALQLPIIVLSATNDKEKIQEVLSLQANDFLNKPFDEITLLTKVKNLLQLQQLNEKSVTDALELQQSEKQLNAIFDFSPTAMFVTDSDARVLRLNKSAENFTNKTQENVYKQLAGDVIQCVYAISKPESCGTHEACKICGLRTSVTETIENQKEIYKRKGHFTIKRNGNIETLILNISTALLKLKTEQLVLLNVDDISRDEKYLAEIKETNDQLNAQAEELLQITEHLDQSNKMLSESERLFRTIFNNNTSGLIIIDFEDTIQLVNEELCSITEYSHEELVGKQWDKILSNNELAKLQSYKKSRISGDNNVPQKYEINFNTKTQKTKVGLINVAVLKSERKIIGSLIDITDRYENEKKIKESETLFKTITKYAQDAIILIDTNDKIKIWNKAAEKIFGYSATEVENKELHSIITPDEYIEKFRKGFAMFKHSGQGNAIGKTVELKGKRKDGNTFPAEISISAITINDQLHAVGIVRDITEKKQYEIILKEKEKQLRQILEYQPIPVCLSKGTQLIYMNRKFKEFFGYTLEEVPDWNNWFLKAYPNEEYREWALKTFSTDVELYQDSPQDAAHRVYKITPKNGIEKHIEISFSFLGEIIIGSFIDITQKVEDQLKLKELNATKDKFVSILAHDLRNPFNSLLGYSEILLKNFNRYDKEKSLKFIGNISNTAKNTYKLLEDLLEWSRSQEGKIPFNPQPAELHSLMHESRLLVSNIAENKKVKIECNIPENELIIVDKEMIKTVFRNLITNAIKFTPENGNISIIAQKNHQTIKIIVNDTGIGMDEKTKNSLFKIGETKSIEGTNGERGTGLGLLLCKDFVEKHNGTISVESELNKGSSFIIKLPINNSNELIMNN